MAWPNKVYVATTALGVYYTETFAGPSGGQPTWEAVNDGLPALDCRQFVLDPHDNAGRQYVLLEATRTLYRRALNGAWEEILTPGDVDTLLSTTDCTIAAFCCDPSVPGRLWATVGSAGTFETPDGYWAIYSDDYGDIWNATTKAVGGGYTRGLGQVRAYGDSVWFATCTNAGGSGRLQFSTDCGATWNTSDDLGGSSWVPRVMLNTLFASKVYANGGGYGGPDLVQVLSGTQTILQADLGPTRDDSMWFSAAQADVQRLIRDGRIYVTDDEWDTVNAPDACSPAPVSVASWSGDDEDQMILSLVLGDHVVGAVADPSSTTPTGLAGASPDTSPYTDSIPNTCGGAATGGVAAVCDEPSEGPTPPPGSTITPPDKPGEEPSTLITLGGDVLTQAVTMPEYEGDERGTPLAGDRSAWEVDDYPEKHASDLNDDEPRYHNPWPLADGEAAVSDGDKLIATDIATQAELDAHEAEANPHGTEMGDLADVDVTTDPVADGDALVWDDSESEWVPADLVEQTEFDDHSARHETGGADEISVAGLSGVLADKQDADKIQGRDVAADAPVDEDVLVWNETTSQWEPQEQSGGGGGHEILDDGEPMPQRSALDFIGFDIADDDYGDATLVALPEGAYAETIGDGVETSYDVVHELGTQDVVVQVWDLDATPIALQAPDIYVVDADTVRVIFADVPYLDQMRVVVVKGGGAGDEDVGFANPMTTAGDLITAGAGGTAGRLGLGTAGQVLKVNAGETAPEWDDESGGGDGIDSHDDSYGSPPAAPSEGDLWVPNDGIYLLRRGASAWVPWGPIFPMVEPDLDDFTWVNQGTATADDSHGGITLYDTARSDNHRMLVMTEPATPYTITACVLIRDPVTSYAFGGLCWRDSASGKVVVFVHSSESGGSLRAGKWNSPTSYSAWYWNVTLGLAHGLMWLRIADDGTSRICSWSVDGQHWSQVHSVSNTDFITADQVGITINPRNDIAMTLLSWEVT